MTHPAGQLFTRFNDVIAAWIRGDGPVDSFARMSASVHGELSVISPDGSSSDGGGLWRSIEGARGANPDFHIATPAEYLRVLHDDSNIVVLEAIELQDGAKAVASSRNARRLTVIFLRDEGAPEGLSLWRLHESFVPAREAEGLDWSPLDAQLSAGS